MEICIVTVIVCVFIDPIGDGGAGLGVLSLGDENHGSPQIQRRYIERRVSVRIRMLIFG